MRLSVAKVFLSLLFVLMWAGSLMGGSQVMAQTPPAVGTSQADRIAALEKSSRTMRQRLRRRRLREITRGCWFRQRWC